MLREAYVGIDLAIAKRKRLPTCVCHWDTQSNLVPIRQNADDLIEIPRGHGNKLAVVSSEVELFVKAVKEYLIELEERSDITIKRIAIDAPSSPKAEGKKRRGCEIGLDRLGISCFTTPSASEFETVRTKVRNHLEHLGSEARIPHANQLWMLVGFELFTQLGQHWEWIEVYPQATMRFLHDAFEVSANLANKKKHGAVDSQLEILSRCTGWPLANDTRPVAQLKGYVRAPAHDAVDAYACALIAALEEPDRIAIGGLKDDSIWVPSKDWLARRRGPN